MHRYHFSDLKEVVTGRATSTCLIDIRPELQYSKRHVRHAVNVVPEKWRTDDVETFIKNLRDLKLHILIRYYMFEYLQKTDGSLSMRNFFICCFFVDCSLGHLADQVRLHSPHFTFVIIKPDTLDSTRQDILHVQVLFQRLPLIL